MKCLFEKHMILMKISNHVWVTRWLDIGIVCEVYGPRDSSGPFNLWSRCSTEVYIKGCATVLILPASIIHCFAYIVPTILVDIALFATLNFVFTFIRVILYKLATSMSFLVFLGYIFVSRYIQRVSVPSFLQSLHKTNNSPLGLCAFWPIFSLSFVYHA